MDDAGIWNRVARVRDERVVHSATLTYCILNHSATNQSTYYQFPPTIPFFSQDLQVTSSQQGSQEARSTLARFFSPKKGSSSKLSPNKPPFRNLSQSCTQDSTMQTLVLFQNLFLDQDLDQYGSSARFPKSSSKDLTGTKSPSTYLCLNLTSLWSNGLSQSTFDKKRSTRCKTGPKSTRNGKFISSSYRSGRSRRSRRYRKIYNCSTKRQNGDHAEHSKLHRVKI